MPSTLFTGTLWPGLKTCFRIQQVLRVRRWTHVVNWLTRQVSIQTRRNSKPLNTRKQLSIIILPNLVYSPLRLRAASRAAFIGEGVFFSFLFPFVTAAPIQITAAETQNPVYTGSDSHKQTAWCSLTAALRDEITRR